MATYVTTLPSNKNIPKQRNKSKSRRNNAHEQKGKALQCIYQHKRSIYKEGRANRLSLVKNSTVQAENCTISAETHGTHTNSSGSRQIQTQ